MALTGNNNHRSVLDDNASLFQITEEKSEKQKWSELTFSQRLQYFLDYYLLKCLIFITLIAVFGIIVWTMTKPQKECKLFFAIVHNAMIPEEKESLETLLTELFITDPKHEEIRVDDSFPNGYESDAKLSTFLSAQEIDLIVTNEKHFQSLAKNDCFVDLNEFMPEFSKKYASYLYQTEGYSEQTAENNSDQNNISSKYISPVKAYGINVTNCKAIKKSWFQEEDAILGIVQNCKQQDNAVKTIKKLFLIK